MKTYIYSIFSHASNKLEFLNDVEIVLENPKIESHGDISCNVAMMLTKKLRKNPRQIAQEIIDNLEYDENIIDKIEIAGPGFINFFFKQAFVTEIIKEIIEKGDNFGKSEVYKGKKANVEYVSANPTGPLTVGHGRNAVLGDTVANILEWAGYEVDREYYFNNAGKQMRILGESVKFRYLELLGDTIEFPETHYQGEYIKTVAKKLYDEHWDDLRDEPADGKFKDAAEKEIFIDIEKTLGRINIKHKKYYNEHTLYDDGRIDDLLKKFEEKGLLYENEGAKWLKLTEMGGLEDRVMVKSTGEPTYRLPDIAYHITKFERGYDRIVDIFGADHKDAYPDVVMALQSLGYNIEQISVVIYQFVTLIQDGKAVKMSTRKANFVTLDDLIDEVGADVVRYFINMRAANTHMNFDLDLAKKQSDENPVFYLQYAHARISSILRSIEDESIKPSLENLSLLTTDEEQSLLKKLYKFEEEILYCAEHFETNKIPVYLEDLAASFHRFYTVCRVLGVEEKLSKARLALITAVRTVIKNGLMILGVSAPEKM